MPTPLDNLFAAISAKDPKGVVSALDAGADPEGIGKGAYTPLQWAALVPSKNEQVISALLGAEVDVNGYGAKGVSPLHLLFMWADPDQSRTVFKLLADAGADLNAHEQTSTGQLGKTAREVACERSWGEAIRAHSDQLEQLTEQIAAAPDPADKLIEDGRPTAILLKLCGEGVIRELFSPSRWKGREEEGIELYKKLIEQATLPPYWAERIKNEVDLAALQRDAGLGGRTGSATDRYTRGQSGPTDPDSDSGS